jgi:hypothetical protein
MKTDEWIKQLQDRMADYEAPVPEDLWEKIETSLADSKQRRPSSLLIPLRRWAVAAVVVALLGGAGFLAFHQDSNTVMQEKLAKVEEQASNESSGETKGTEAVEAAVTESQEMAEKVKAAVIKPEKNSEQTIAVVPEVITESEMAAEPEMITESEIAAVSEMITESEIVAEPEKSAESVVAETSVNSAIDLLPYEPLASSHQRKEESRWTAGLLASSGQSLDGLSGDGDYAANNPIDGNPYQCNFPSNDGIYVGKDNDMGMPENEWTHKMPISYGMSISYRLSPKWSLQSGLVYTRLSADVKRWRLGSMTDYHQQLHYLGIPVGVSCQLWKHKSLLAYWQGGGQVDMNVKATMETDGVKNNENKDRLMWSARTALGVQLMVMPQWGVYVEPGFQYHFDNGSSVQNYYKENKLNLSLQFGVRFEVK